MKNIYSRLFCLLMITISLAACREEYELQVGFDAPASLTAPVDNQLINIDLENNTPLVFEWPKATTYYSGVVIYEIYIDKENGDFSNPLLKSVTNAGGADNWFSMSPKQLIALAKAAGIAVNSEGTIQWKVTASQGGERKEIPGVRKLRLHRPDGIADVPTQLYAFGSGFEVKTLDKAFPFRKMEEGVFEVYASVVDGEIKLCNNVDGEIIYYKLNDDNKLIESADGSGITVNGTGNGYRVLVDFNLLSVKLTEIKEIKLVRTWETALGSFTYAGNHQFKAQNVPISYYMDWGYEEDRYRFWVTTNVGQERWGSYESDSMFGTLVPGMTPFDGRPDGNQPAGYYNVYNLADLNTAGQNADWTGMYKFPSAAKDKSANITLDMSPTGAAYTQTFTVLP